jgi:hypothetical protein
MNSAARPFNWVVVDGDRVALSDGADYPTLAAAVAAMEDGAAFIHRPERFVVREERDFDARGGRELYYHECRPLAGYQADGLGFLSVVRSRHAGTRRDVVWRACFWPVVALLAFFAILALIIL